MPAQESGAAYIAQTFIMEQYLDGPEVDVDVVVSQVSTGCQLHEFSPAPSLAGLKPCCPRPAAP